MEEVVVMVVEVREVVLVGTGGKKQHKSLHDLTELHEHTVLRYRFLVLW